MRKQIETGMLNGSYTVEASILVSLILLIIMAWIYLSFSFHDRLVCRSLALFYAEGAGRMLEEPVSGEGRLRIERICENSGLISGFDPEKIDAAVLQERFRNAAGQLMLTGHMEDVRIIARKKEIGVYYAAEEHVPSGLSGQLLSFIGEIGGEVVYTASMAPEEFVRTARGIIWRE